MESHAVEHVEGRRMPGKYFVIGFVSFVAILFVFALILAIRLDPAAERFHNPPSPAKKAG